MDLIIAQLDFDSEYDEDESNHIKRNINTVDFEAKINALKHYNSIIDKRIELKNLSKNYGVVKSVESNPFENLTHLNT